MDVVVNQMKLQSSAHLKLVSLVVSLRQLLPRAQSSMNVTVSVYGNFCDPSLETIGH